MFRNKLFLGRIEHFLKFKHKNKTRSSTCCMHSNVSPINPQKFSLVNCADINGFHETFSSKGNFRGLQTSAEHYSKFYEVKCWSCNKTVKIKDFACPSCGSLQHPEPSLNYFQLLGVSQTFDIDLEDLSKKFKKLQMSFHPDKFAKKSQEELKISEEYSRLLNRAYTTLKDPVARGFYLLEFQNIPKETDFPMQQDFLLKIMEENEKLDSVDNATELFKLQDDNNENIIKQITAVKCAFNSNNLEKAKQNLLKLNYYMNLNSKIKEKEGELTFEKP